MDELLPMFRSMLCRLKDADPIRQDEPIKERLEYSSTRTGIRAVLFGLGHHAKTQIIPNLPVEITLDCVHEIDPNQLASMQNRRVSLDTSPWPRNEERYDIWFIAGYHHTHAPLAVRALYNRACAVIEKPVATTWKQLKDLQDALGSADDRRMFCCFHKRYMEFNKLVRDDLCIGPNDPINMHCIIYEIPLPQHHWYNWPASGSRLMSNGCHWLDYFMFMNGYPQVEDVRLWHASKSNLAVHARLTNGAIFNMSLTDIGSARLGVRDIIDLRAGKVTVRLVDSTYYEAENSHRVLRRVRQNPMAIYRGMYRTICKRILSGQSGDHPDSLRSTELMLTLEDALQS
jgi:predicted dehydrogenase